MSDEIHITAEPQAVPSQCKFMVDRPVYDSRSYWFGSAEAAELSPLAKRLFEISGVSAVLVSHQTITLTKSTPDPWQFVGPQAGAAIRAHIQSGEEAVSAALTEQLPSSAELRERVESVIATEVAPSVAQHGGSIQVVDVKDNNVLIQMGGGCQGCSSATATLKYGVEAAIRKAVPEVGEIIDTTNHGAGANPYM